MTHQEQPTETVQLALTLASKPFSEVKGLNDVRFAVWELLEACYPWTDDTLRYQDRPLLGATSEQRDEFIRLKINAHKRKCALIWHEELLPDRKELDKWVAEKLAQIEHVFLHKDELATIEKLCNPIADGRCWPIHGKPARWWLYASLFNRLMLTPPVMLTPGSQLPISDLAQAIGQIKSSIVEPMKHFAEFATDLRETIVHGRPLSPQERQIKAAQEQYEREQYEIRQYGKILRPAERKQAMRREQLERAEEAAHQAKLRALEAERREADERAREPFERLYSLRKSALLKNQDMPKQISMLERLQPGVLRTLQTLKQAYPKGLTIKELAPLTKKDSLAEETPEGSLYAWLNSLQKRGMAKSNTKRPKQWFFVTDEP